VLIPRPETEELVEIVRSIYRNKHHAENYQISMLDIGTGSGCIAIALKRYFEDWKVTAMEKSKKAIELAMFNAELLGTDIKFIEADILAIMHCCLGAFRNLYLLDGSTSATLLE
jgi:release factor glutamine methyltransferase